MPFHLSLAAPPCSPEGATTGTLAVVGKMLHSLGNSMHMHSDVPGTMQKPARGFELWVQWD